MIGCSPGGGECFASEKPEHHVTITSGFWMGQTAVIVGAWKRYVRQVGKPMPPVPVVRNRGLNPDWSDDRQPIVNITWYEASAFCTAAGARLPIEAEWEYAARAGSTAERYGDLDKIAWYAFNSGNHRIDRAALQKDDAYLKNLIANGSGPKPVGLKEPNAWKLYDMLGNVFQWTADWYAEKYYTQGDALDPRGPSHGQTRAVRGASWMNDPLDVRVSIRFNGYRDQFHYDHRAPRNKRFTGRIDPDSRPDHRDRRGIKKRLEKSLQQRVFGEPPLGINNLQESPPTPPSRAVQLIDALITAR